LSLQTTAATALWHLSHSPQNQDHIRAAGGIEVRLRSSGALPLPSLHLCLVILRLTLFGCPPPPFPVPRNTGTCRYAVASSGNAGRAP
jgi:hypothetical protein